MFRGCRIAAGEGFEAPEAGSEAARSLQQLLSRFWKQIPRLQDRCGGLGSLRESGSLQGPEPGALQEPGSLQGQEPGSLRERGSLPGSLREPGSLQGQAPGSLRAGSLREPGSAARTPNPES